MPKPKPDQVVRHEIVLGRSERELISDGLLAYQINRISTPLVALLSDASAMGLIFGGIATYYGFKFDVGTRVYDSSLDLYNDFKTQYDAHKKTLRDIKNDPLGSLIEFIGSMIPRPDYSQYTNVDRGYGQPGRPYGPSDYSGVTNPGDLY
jgi:hypothetical protein